MKVLVTGSAGFIGFHLVKHLINRGDEVVGIDNINNYYDIQLKHDRLAETGIPRYEIRYGKEVNSTRLLNYTFLKIDITDEKSLRKIFEKYHFDAVCNLAAQAGVRYSLINPGAYVDTNIRGFLNVLECCRHQKIKHLIYASSSSVYGLNKKMPFSVTDNVDHPVSLYAATKKSNELMAHSYSHLFGLPTTGLRFFTVYGPWGRPDMALYLFTKAMADNQSISIFNQGEMKRDFTYIDDIIRGILKVLDKPATSNSQWNGMNPDPATSRAPYRIFNIGRGNSVNLMDFIAEIEKNMQVDAVKQYFPLQDGDVADTWADLTALKDELNYLPQISVKEGVKSFVDWYRLYYSYSRHPEVV
jgi:UDP-glucuronate 4-epimerase